MAGSTDAHEDSNAMPHSPRLKRIIQHFDRLMNKHVDDLAEDVRVTNERLGQLETTQLTTGTTLRELQQAQATTNTSLATITTRLDELVQQLADARAGFDYCGDTEQEDPDQPRRPRGPRRVVRHQDDSFAKIKFTIPTFNGKYDPDAYLDWEIAVDQKFACHAVPEQHQVRAATSEFTDFASIWWREHCSTHPTQIPPTWAALKVLMRHRFVPSYYARDMLNKLQRLQQGSKSVEEYFQELQIGMLRCGLVENNDAAMARFLGGLNHEIQIVLDYKEYNTITRLFHLACIAEREVQGRQTRTHANSFAGRTTSFKPATKPVAASSSAAPSPPNITSRDPAATKTPSAPTPTRSSSFANGRTKDIQCHRCKGFGHVIRDCPNKRVLIVREDGEYSSASDLDEPTYAMLATDISGHEEEEHVAALDADKYESLVVQRVLSTQAAQPEKHQRHNLFHTKGIVQERSIRIIIDGGSCNNLASTDLVEKLSLQTRPHPHPYHIQWLNQGGKLKVTRSVRVHFSMGSYHDYVDCDVVPMEACSLLLGRPWQYDTDSMHHGRTNQYSLMFKGKKIIFHPMSPEQILKDDLARATREHKPSAQPNLQKEIKLNAPVLLATLADLNEWDVPHSLCYALLCTNVLVSLDDTALLDIPPAVTKLLQDFADVFPKEVPAGLPPIRGIEHQIDLIPGAPLPNRAAYRTNPDETKEIQR